MPDNCARCIALRKELDQTAYALGAAQAVIEAQLDYNSVTPEDPEKLRRLRAAWSVYDAAKVSDRKEAPHAVDAPASDKTEPASNPQGVDNEHATDGEPRPHAKVSESARGGSPSEKLERQLRCLRMVAMGCCSTLSTANELGMPRAGEMLCLLREAIAYDGAEE